jgi:putative lipoic acid-binding regulatory protein
LSDGPSDPGSKSKSDERTPESEIALLEACFQFPSNFSVSVIARNEVAVAAAVLAEATAAGGEPPAAHEVQPSKGGKYVSHRMDVRCANAHEAHALRLRLRAVPGVMSVL